MADNRIGTATQMPAMVAAGSQKNLTSSMARAVSAGTWFGRSDAPPVNQIATHICATSSVDPIVNRWAGGPPS